MTKKIQELGVDAGSGTPLESDFNWIRENAIIPTFKHQPNIVNSLGITPTPVALDGPEFTVAPKYSDVGDLVYAFEVVENNQNFLMTTDTAYMPIIQGYVELTDQDMALSVAGRDRLVTFTVLETKKFAQKENRSAFQGGPLFQGFIGSDSYDLGAPTAAWGIVTAENGYLDNMITDIQKIITYFNNQAFIDIPFVLAVDVPIYTLMKTTKLVKTPGTMYDVIMSILPAGSSILASNDINSNYNDADPASPSTNSKVCAILKSPPDWTYGLSIFSSGIRQKYHKLDVNKHKWWFGERFAVKVRDDKLVCWMDAISLATS